MALPSLLYVILGVSVPVIAEIEMEFTKYPESVTAPVGDEVTFECAVRVPGERLTWRWRADDDQEWRDWNNVDGINDKDGVTTRLVVQVRENTPTSLYQCMAWYGSIILVSIPARLTIAKIDLSRNSPERRVILAPLHNSVVLHCKEPRSEPPAKLSWWKETTKGSRKQLDTSHGVLVINNATVEDSGTYGCTAINDISEQTADLPERTYLKVQHEGHGGFRFLETEDYVGTIDKDRVLTMPVMPDNSLRLWCGAVGTPQPRVVWSKGTDTNLPGHTNSLVIENFTGEHEGVYSCSANALRRSWKVVALQPPHWEGSANSVNASEGLSARISCGVPHGQPAPVVHWMFNAELVKTGKGIKATDSDMYIERVEKRHAGVVQCFACNSLGCAYDAAMLTVVPVQISDQDYSAETPKIHIPSQSPKRHNKKNPRKHKAVLIPPSRPNVTRLSDKSVMVSWSHDNHGLPIQFFKVQYREVTNSSNIQWHTESTDIPTHIHSFEIDGLYPDKYYKFRIAAVYSNQDNKLGRSSGKFFLQRGGTQSPRAPTLDKATSLSPHSIQLNWTWSAHGGVEAEGFYVYYRAVSWAGAYEKVTAAGHQRSMVMAHLAPDTAYELKIQAYTAQAPSDFSAILIAKTQRALNAPSTSTEAPAKEEESAPGTLVTAGGAAGAAALLLILAGTFLLCRRAKRPHADKEKGPGPEGGTNNGYLPAKVPITITANPMHGEGGDSSVEMSFLHNNNCGNNANSDDTLPHSRKNGPSRQYV
ncbi:interference hedgehog isoform X1 [Bicyclus anynana]|uniref:Interference hedgehog isoform X1 n=1 Tax=Bicyclus anynana TaxID=110368 RepID=A0ABM3LS98_BICAN|nr:interference hedgehog isoform X1 [Bicyclus anynana]